MEVPVSSFIRSLILHPQISHLYYHPRHAGWRPLTGDPLAAAGLQLAGLQSADFRPPTPCTFGAVPATPIARSLIEIH